MQKPIWEQSFNILALRNSLPKNYMLQVIDGECYRWVNVATLSVGIWRKQRSVSILTAWVFAVRDANNAKK